MRAFLTGIDGFVGRHLTALLAESGHAVWGGALAADTTVEGAERVLACDVRDADRVADVLREADPEVVVHLAGQTSVAAAFDDPAGTFRTNALGTLHVLEACRAVGVDRVLVVSSSEVYGTWSPSEGRVRETAPLAPVTPYGASKAAQDLLGYQYARGTSLAVIRARAFPHTGPGQDPRFVFPSVARRIAETEAGAGPPEIRVGWLGATRDVSDVRDVVRAYVGLLERGESGQAYNVCRGEGRTIAEALETLLALAETPVRLVVDEQRLRPTEVPWMVGDPTKLRRATGWEPVYDWERTARDLMESARAQVRKERKKERGGS